jgi:hypothetical protein
MSQPPKPTTDELSRHHSHNIATVPAAMTHSAAVGETAARLGAAATRRGGAVRPAVSDMPTACGMELSNRSHAYVRNQ